MTGTGVNACLFTRKGRLHSSLPHPSILVYTDIILGE